MFLKRKKKKKGFFEVGKYTILDIGLIKLAVFAFTLFFVSYVPQVASLELRWFWLIIAILAMIRPFLKGLGR